MDSEVQLPRKRAVDVLNRFLSTAFNFETPVYAASASHSRADATSARIDGLRNQQSASFGLCDPGTAFPAIWQDQFLRCVSLDSDRLGVGAALRVGIRYGAPVGGSNGRRMAWGGSAP